MPLRACRPNIAVRSNSGIEPWNPRAGCRRRGRNGAEKEGLHVMLYVTSESYRLPV